MKKLIILSLLVCIAGFAYAQDSELPSLTPKNYEFYQVTTIESVVPGGFGRSRMLTRDEKGRQGQEKMENFFSMVGINFGNIEGNEAQIGNKLQELTNQGWELFSTVGGVYSADKSTGLFITRYIFRKEKK